MKLSKAEEIAKENFLLLIREGDSECDSEFLNIDLPSWYDDAKYKLGQKFYTKNRIGVLNATINGVIASMSDNRALRVIASTGNSSTKDTAAIRYVKTVQHFMIWYEKVLTIPNSESRKSLDKVRKLHVINSKIAKENGLGGIKQFELVLTAFGFYAFAIFRSHLYGIPDNNQEEREGFLHFWAVVSRMVGVCDKLNICLLPYDALEILYQMITRYILLPLVQVQTPLHKHMMTAFIEGFGQHFPTPLEYESQFFLMQMLCGVPGYQYGCNLDKEIFSRSNILSKKEIFDCNKILKDCMGEDYFEITYDIPVIELKNDKIQRKYVNYEDDWRSLLNDSKFYKMNFKGQQIVRTRHYFTKLYEYTVFKYLIEWCMSWNISIVKNMK